MKGTRAWLVVSPVSAAGVLVAHALAYRLTGTPTGAFHAYLGHAPQVLLLLGLFGLALAGLGSRREGPPAWVFPAVALATFVAQEHLERILHGAGVPLLLTTPVFVLGLALQLPVALLAWMLARKLLAAVEREAPGLSLRPRLELDVPALMSNHLASTPRPAPLSRGPPRPVPSR